MFMWYVNSVMTQTGLHPESRLQPLLVDIRSKTAGSHLSSNGHAPATSRTEFMMQALDKDASTCLWMWVCMYVIVYPAGGWSLPEPGLLFKTLGGMSGRQLGQEQGVGGWGGVGWGLVGGWLNHQPSPSHPHTKTNSYIINDLLLTSTKCLNSPQDVPQGGMLIVALLLSAWLVLSIQVGQFSRSFHSGIMVPYDFLSRVRLTLGGGVRSMFTVDVCV